MKRSIEFVACLLVFEAGRLGFAAEPVSSSGTQESRCASLASTEFSTIVDAPSQITSTQLVGAKGNSPAYCRVVGYVMPTVGIELRLPEPWNGKFMHVGCGGHCGMALEGYFSSSCDDPLRKGYACIASDMGHKGTGMDGLWAYHNLQAKIDWGYRATHVATLAGKAITQRYYTRKPQRSYFMGCSTGGRQGLQEAQRFPQDFDGILAGAPPIDLSTLYMTFAWGMHAAHDSAGNALLDNDDLKALTAAAVTQCDLDDGVKDGVIGDPLQCPFDPATLACKRDGRQRCLTSAQIAAVKKIYAGPMMSNGVKLSLGGPLPGSEYSAPSGGLQNDWSATYTGLDGKPAAYEELVTNAFRYLLFSPEPGPTWKLSDLDFDRDSRRLGVLQSLYDSGNPDLRRFTAAGGKLLIYQGLNDNAVMPRSTVDYYETVERTMGGRKTTQDFFRLFLLPGVNHCSGGVGADAVDFLGALEAWVEQGRAPDQLLGAHLKQSDDPAYPYRPFPADAKKIAFTRPIFPYPLKAKYRGRGNPNDAANFSVVKDKL